MIQFALENAEYIELDKLLKRLGFADTGGEAHQCITRGEVHVNKIVETRKRKKLRPGDKVGFKSHMIEIIAN
jgi:ribosome-associated protein